MKKQNRVITLCGISAIAFVLLVILSFEFFPVLMAKREAKKTADELIILSKESKMYATVSDTDSYGFSIETGGEASDEVRYDGERALSFAENIANVLRSSKYSGKEDVPTGSWDTRLRFSSPDGKSIITLYLTADGRLYFVKGATRFYFTPKNAIAVKSND